MGSAISRLIDNLMGNIEAQVSLLGLDAAGKTTMLYKMKLGEVTNTVPTVGFNTEEINYKQLKMVAWDVGGQAKLRRLWHHYYNSCDALIFVVDSTDAERFPDVVEELSDIINSGALPDRATVLIYANKQDSPRAVNVTQLQSALNVDKVCRGRQWFIQPCSALSGEGLYEGLDWLLTSIKESRKTVK